MSPSTAAGGLPAIERLRAIASRQLGLRFDEGKSDFLAKVLERRSAAIRAGAEDYLDALESRDPPRDELRALAQELTVTETYFFRNAEQLRAFAEVALPARARASSPPRPLRILSAGCASGEEAYSLAILLRDHPQAAGRDVELHAIDVNTAMLSRAARGHYSPWALRETPGDVRARCFRADGRDFILEETVRSAVKFTEGNLIHEDASFWWPQRFDVVFCRNVLMYFAPENAAAVVARIARSLTPGGYLFLGYAETLRGLSQDFHLVHTHGTFYYQRRFEAPSEGHESAPAEPPAWVPREGPANASAPGSSAAAPPPSLLALSSITSDTAWIEAIGRASERIASLTSGPMVPPDSEAPAEPAPWDLERVVELMRRERFGEALALVTAFPAESNGDPDVLMLRAVLSTHGGDLVAAEALCAEILRLDERSAGAHYLLALCREGAGDRAGALDHDQVATYLDPTFAMPRLHLGLMARRSGDQETARRDLKEALRLLHAEESSRLLLFAGGFTREALQALCRSQLTAPGGAP